MLYDPTSAKHTHAQIGEINSGAATSLGGKRLCSMFVGGFSTLSSPLRFRDFTLPEVIMVTAFLSIIKTLSCLLQ